MKNWFETMDDRLWLKPDAVGEDEARFLKDALHLRKGQAVLDAPCGAGRIAVHLARAGCLVTGYDLREAFIGRADKRFRQAGLKGTFVVGDLRKMDFRGDFHAAFNWLGSFGYFDDGGNLEVVRRYARSLLPGGRLLIDQPNREFLLRNFIPVRDAGSMTVRNRWDREAERIVSERVIDGVSAPKNRSSMRLYTPSQMRLLLEEAGLKIETIYGSFAGDGWRRSSRRMITVARKQ